MHCGDESSGGEGGVERADMWGKLAWFGDSESREIEGERTLSRWIRSRCLGNLWRNCGVADDCTDSKRTVRMRRSAEEKRGKQTGVSNNKSVHPGGG